MTAKERAFFARVRRRAATLEPGLRRAYLASLEKLRASIPTSVMERLIDNGEVERLLDTYLSDEKIKSAFAEYERATVDAVQRATEQMAREIPANLRKLAAGGIRFDYLNPRVIDAVKQLDDRVMRGLAEGIRETVRAQVETGLQAGLNPRTVARHLDLKLAPNQALAIQHYREALEAGNTAKALSYKLRDARFDAATVKGMTSAQIDRAVGAYSRRMYAFNAETQARTAALDAQRLGQRLSIEDAIDKGIYDRTKMYMRWVTVGDDRVRPEHEAMNGEVARFDGTFSNGETVPGETTYNCRCEAVYFEEEHPERIAQAEAARREALQREQEKQAA